MSQKIEQKYIDKFEELVDKDSGESLTLFLKSFIFELGDKWKEVVELEKTFKKALEFEGKVSLNPVMAADLLQKTGHERTALQRKQEVGDIDLDNNQRIAFIEFLLLNYKTMVLNSYYKRTEKTNPHDLSKGGVGIVGVGAILLEELFTMPEALDPALEAAIEEFNAERNAKEARLVKLRTLVEKGGVKGMAAKNELAQIDAADQTEVNRLEITLKAAKRRAAKTSGAAALEKKQKEEEDKKKKILMDGRASIKARAAMWENK